MEVKRKISILIIDECKAFSKVLARTLESRGSAVLQAFSWKNAAELINRPGIDLVLLNLAGFKKDGLDMLTMIKERMPDLPVIILGSHEDQYLSFDGMKRGATDYFTIPLDISELARALERASVLVDAQETLENAYRQWRS